MLDVDQALVDCVDEWIVGQIVAGKGEAGEAVEATLKCIDAPERIFARLLFIQVFGNAQEVVEPAVAGARPLHRGPLQQVIGHHVAKL